MSNSYKNFCILQKFPFNSSLGVIQSLKIIKERNYRVRKRKLLFLSRSSTIHYIWTKNIPVFCFQSNTSPLTKISIREENSYTPLCLYGFVVKMDFPKPLFQIASFLVQWRYLHWVQHTIVQFGGEKCVLFQHWKTVGKWKTYSFFVRV